MKLKTSLLFIFVIEFKFQTWAQTIPVCPPKHPRAFEYGKKCCNGNDRQKNAIPRQSQDCLSGDIIDCPQGHDCEDHPQTCYDQFELEGFGQDYDGYYGFQDRYENGKPIYMTKSEKCVWWLLRLRQWHLGECGNVGTHKSFAYIDADLQCPHPEEE